MPTYRPPRREPRVLAITRSRSGLLFASVDPWEIRSTGRVARDAPVAAALRRLVRQEKPSLVALSPALRRSLGAEALPIPVARLPAAPVAVQIASALYPDIALMAPRPAHARLCRLAVSLVLGGDIPKRPYAHPRR
jgi:hypothetical protein